MSDIFAQNPSTAPSVPFADDTATATGGHLDEPKTTPARRAAPAKAKKARAAAGITRAQVEGIIEKHSTISSLPSDQSELLAASLGLPVTASPLEIVVEVYTAKTNINPVAIVERLRSESDPVEQFTDVLALDKPELKAVWNLLVGVTEASGTLSSNDIAAAKQVSRALGQVDELVFITLGEVKDLGSR